MRATLLIALASIATQLPARDVAPAASEDSAYAGACSSEGTTRAYPVADERMFRLYTVSRSVI